METAFDIKLTDKKKEEIMVLDTDKFQERLTGIFRDVGVTELYGGKKYKTIPESKFEGNTSTKALSPSSSILQDTRQP